MDAFFEQSGLKVLDRHRMPLNITWLKYETDLIMWTQQEFTVIPRTKMDQASLVDLDKSWQEQMDDIKAGASLQYNLTTFVAQRGN